MCSRAPPPQGPWVVFLRRHAWGGRQGPCSWEDVDQVRAFHPQKEISRGSSVPAPLGGLEACVGALQPPHCPGQARVLQHLCLLLGPWSPKGPRGLLEAEPHWPPRETLMRQPTPQAGRHSGAEELLQARELPLSQFSHSLA